MHALHAFWSLGRGAHLWAEDADLPVTSPSDAVRSARSHPFAVPVAELAGELGVPDGHGESSAILLLPSLRRSPTDSPTLVRVRPRPDTTKPPMLLPWTVPALRMDPETAWTVLDRRVDGIRYDASITFLAEVASFARDLVRRGRVLPRLAPGEPCHARWRPVLLGPDIVSLQSLALAMPPVWRSETGPRCGDRGPLPNELMTDALSALVDTAVRERLAGAPLRVLPPRRGRRPKQPPAAESWLEALSTPDGRLTATHDALQTLADALTPWSDFGTGTVGPARATFRLTAPDPLEAPHTGLDGDGAPDPHVAADAPEWRLDFLLQSVEDPSLLIPADQVWAGADALQRFLHRPDELLLTELGRASGLFPELATALRQPRPTCLRLDTQGAFGFLSDRAAVLDQAGFGVLLPGWWSKRRRLGLRGSASTPQDRVDGGRFGRDTLVDFDWRLALGDDPLTEEELAALVAAKAPLVRLRGEWVSVDPDQIMRGLEFLTKGRGQRKTVAEVLALAAAHPDDLDTPLPVTAVQAEGRLGDLLAGCVDLRLEPVQAPDGFRARLRPYQERGLSWLAFLSGLGLGGCLADDMGLGKTIQLLALEAYQRGAEPGAGPTLLVCPMSLVGNWEREAAKFAPMLHTYAHHGAQRRHGDDLLEHLAGVDIVITTYQTAMRDIEELEAHEWNRVVLDEAQAVKNSRSRSAQAVRRLPAAHRVALTGTPVENRLSELWSVMDFVNPGLLGSPELFRTRYAVPVEVHGQTEPAQRLRRITRPYLLRRLKTDRSIIDDLPDKIEVKQYCRLTAEQASLYQTVVDEMMERIESSEGITRRGNVLAAMTKLKQVCNHPAQLLHDGSPLGRRSGKVIRLEEIVEEILAEDDRALLFTQFTEFAEMLLPHLAARFDRDVLYLSGKTPKKRRDEIVAQFQQESGPPLFLLSLKAGGTGLNLTAARHVVHLDRWWNPAVEDQATDRAFRIGQRHNVQVRKFICTGTVEEKVDDLLEEKKALADLVVRDGEQWLTELSTGDLRDLLTLSEGAGDE